MKIEFKYCKENTHLTNALNIPASDNNFRFFRFGVRGFLSSDSGLAQSKPDDFYLRSPGTNLSVLNPSPTMLSMMSLFLVELMQKS